MRLPSYTLLSLFLVCLFGVIQINHEAHERVKTRAVEMEKARGEERQVGYQRVADCLRHERNQTRIATEDWKFSFLCTLPTPEAKWPIKGKEVAESDSLTISTLVPGLPEDLESNLPALLQSMREQTQPTDEIIIVISNVQTLKDFSHRGGVEWCRQAQQKLGEKVRVVCIAERLTAGRARNVAAHLASGTIFSFIDSDDLEFPIRNQIVRNMFGCYRKNLRVFIHGYVRNYGESKHPYDIQRKRHKDKSPYGYIPSGEECADEEDGVEVQRYAELREVLDATQERLWLSYYHAHGHVVVHRSVFDHFQFNTMAYGEDSVFIRDIVYGYGREKDAVVFLNRPLTTYYELDRKSVV